MEAAQRWARLDRRRRAPRGRCGRFARDDRSADSDPVARLDRDRRSRRAVRGGRRADHRDARRRACARESAARAAAGALATTGRPPARAGCGAPLRCTLGRHGLDRGRSVERLRGERAAQDPVQAAPDRGGLHARRAARAVACRIDAAEHEMIGQPSVGLVGVVVLLALLITGMPIGVALGIAGLGGLTVTPGLEPALIKSGVLVFETMTRYELGTLPLFMLMAHLCFTAGASGDFFGLAARLFGHRRGGLAIASVAGCAGFGS